MYNIINIINTVAYYHELRVQNPKILVHKAKKVLFFFYLYCGIHFMIDINETLQTSDQIRSVSQLCLTLCNPINCSMQGLPVHHQLPEFTQTHVHQVSDAIQPSHPQLSPSPLAPNPSQHQSLFQ